MSKTNLRHPPTLRIFFATEMWERYGFYVVQTLLALYLALHSNWHDKRTYALVGSFTALTYISPVIGGWIADHLLGQKRAILCGAIALFISYIALSFHLTDTSFISSLAGIAVGTGLLKPNISSLLGNEYPIGSPNKESGFTIFYMGITSGIILGTTIPSYLNDYFGWSIAFGSAAIGIIIAIFTFSYGIYQYQIQDYHPYEFKLKKVIAAIICMVGLWLVSFFILNNPAIANITFIGVVLLSLTYLLFCMKTQSPMQSKQTLVLTLLCGVSILFWAFYFQMFMSFTLFLVRVVEPNLFGMPFPPPYYVGMQSVGMIIIGFIFARRRKHLNQAERGIEAGNKFLLAMVFMCLAYIIITIACHIGPAYALLSPLYLIPAYLMISVAELLLSPVGLSIITTLASPTKVSTMMGIFLVSLGLGGFLSGKLAELTAIPSSEQTIEIIKTHYTSSFTQLLGILIAATVVCFIINLFIKHLMTSIQRADILPADAGS